MSRRMYIVLVSVIALLCVLLARSEHERDRLELRGYVAGVSACR